MQRVVGVFVLVVCACLLAGCGGTSPQAKARDAARTAARNLGDRSVTAADLYGPASYQAAYSAWSGGLTAPSQTRGRFYVIVLHGRFVGPGGHARTVAELWSADRATAVAVSFRRQLPASMSRLGRPAIISLS